MYLIIVTTPPNQVFAPPFYTAFFYMFPFKTDKASVLVGRLQAEGYICYVCRHLITPHCSTGTLMDSLRKRAAVHHWTGFIFASLMKSPSTSSTGASLAEIFSSKIFFELNPASLHLSSSVIITIRPLGCLHVCVCP